MAAEGVLASVLSLLSLIVGGVLLFGGSLLFPIGMGLIAGGAFVVAARTPTVYAPVIARARGITWLPDVLCAALLMALTLVMLGKVAAGDRPISFDHTVHYFQAWLLKERLWHDGWFFWSNLWFAGYPV